METRRIIDQVVAVITNSYPEVVLAYLFGSQARGIANRLSDVDIAVLVRENRTAEQCLNTQICLMQDLTAALERNDVDVVILNRAKLPLRHQVLRYGQLIYCIDDQARYRFTYETNRDYLDMAHLYKVQREYLYRRIREGEYGRRREDYRAAFEKVRGMFEQAAEPVSAS